MGSQLPLPELLVLRPALVSQQSVASWQCWITSQMDSESELSVANLEFGSLVLELHWFSRSVPVRGDQKKLSAAWLQVVSFPCRTVRQLD